MADKVEALIRRLGPAPICDACIVERLHLSALHQANHRTRALAGHQGFESLRDTCMGCGETGPVIRWWGG